MPERVIVKQNASYEVDILATDPRDVLGEKLVLVDNVYDLTPYTMLLSSLGTCTTILVHSYAENHGFDVDEVEVRLTYGETETKDDEIVVFVDVRGDELSEADRLRLIQISKHCSIHKVLDKGVPIQWHAFDATAEHDHAHHTHEHHDHEQHDHEQHDDHGHDEPEV